MPNVWYVGPHLERRIAASDWLYVGAPGASVKWGPENGYAIDQSTFSSAQLNVLANDREFLLGQSGLRPTPPNPANQELNDFNYLTAARAYYSATKSIFDVNSGLINEKAVASKVIVPTWVETTDKQAAPVRPGIVAIGDSFTSLSYITTPYTGASFSRTESWISNSYLTCAMVYAGQPCTVLSKGIGGDTAANGVTRFDTDVLSYLPQVVIVEFGTNDIALNATALATFNNLLTMWKKAWPIGAKVIGLTCPPRNTFTTAQQKEAQKLNSMIRNFARANPQNFALVDMWRALADVSNGGYKSGYTIDGVHPNTLGCWVVGKLFKPAIDRFVFGNAPLAASNINDDNIFAAPMFLSSGGSFIGSGLTGTVAANCFAYTAGTSPSSSAVASLVDRGDGSKWQQFSISAAANDSVVFQLSQFIMLSGGAFAPGEIIQACVEFETDAAGWTNGQLNMTLNCVATDGSTSYSYAGAFGNTDPNGVFQARPESGVLITPPFVIPPNTNQLTFTAFKGGLGTIRFGKPAIRKLPVS